MRCPGHDVADAGEALEHKILDALHSAPAPAYPALINATGVLLHTNLGRAPLQRQLSPSLKSYLALEFNVTEGRRGQRLAPLADRIAKICGRTKCRHGQQQCRRPFLLLTAHARA